MRKTFVEDMLEQEGRRLDIRTAVGLVEHIAVPIVPSMFQAELHSLFWL